MEQLSPDFWTIRGDFRIAGVLNIGTQMSLVRRRSGRFVLIDSYDAEPRELAAIEALTEGGRAIEAIVNVHPFHTLHCRATHHRFPHAELIGTERHRRQYPDLRWSDELIEQTATQQRFAEDFDFSIPRGVDFISQDETVHVASVLVRHRESRIVHVDDTFNVFVAPALLRPLLPGPRLRFHPMLGKALERSGGPDRRTISNTGPTVSPPAGRILVSSAPPIPPCTGSAPPASAVKSKPRSMRQRRL